MGLRDVGWPLLMEPADTSLDGQDWSEHLGGLKPKSLTRSVDNLEGQQHRVTETNAVILMQISLIFFPPSKVAFWFERNQDQSKKKKGQAGHMLDLSASLMHLM